MGWLDRREHRPAAAGQVGRGHRLPGDREAGGRAGPLHRGGPRWSGRGGGEYTGGAELRGRGEENSEESEGAEERGEEGGAPIIEDDDRWDAPERERRRVTEVAARRSSRGSLEESRMVARILTAREAVQ